MRRKWIFIAPLAIVGMVVFITIGGVVVQLLWNWLLPPLFGWPAITFWQGIGLLALCRILFGGLGRNGCRPSRMRHSLRERWEGMTPEERERFRQGLRDRLGFRPPAGDTKTS
jgi:hypothetical protein